MEWKRIASNRAWTASEKADVLTMSGTPEMDKRGIMNGWSCATEGGQAYTAVVFMQVHRGDGVHSISSSTACRQHEAHKCLCARAEMPALGVAAMTKATAEPLWSSRPSLCWHGGGGGYDNRWTLTA